MLTLAGILPLTPTDHYGGDLVRHSTVVSYTLAYAIIQEVSDTPMTVAVLSESSDRYLKLIST